MTQHPWNELNASLHAATVMSLRSGEKKLCKLCREPDHACALSSLQFPQPQQQLSPTSPSALPAASRRVSRPETLKCICTSWNRGRCAFPGSCRLHHICASCKRKGHRARECDDTAADSPYKVVATALQLSDKPSTEAVQR